MAEIIHQPAERNGCACQIASLQRHLGTVVLASKTHELALAKLI